MAYANNALLYNFETPRRAKGGGSHDPNYSRWAHWGGVHALNVATIDKIRRVCGTTEVGGNWEREFVQTLLVMYTMTLYISLYIITYINLEYRLDMICHKQLSHSRNTLSGPLFPEESRIPVMYIIYVRPTRAVRNKQSNTSNQNHDSETK